MVLSFRSATRKVDDNLESFLMKNISTSRDLWGQLLKSKQLKLCDSLLTLCGACFASGEEGGIDVGPSSAKGHSSLQLYKCPFVLLLRQTSEIQET